MIKSLQTYSFFIRVGYTVFMISNKGQWHLHVEHRHGSRCNEALQAGNVYMVMTSIGPMHQSEAFDLCLGAVERSSRLATAY